MTGFTKMGSAPAEPLCNRAAKFAFEFYKIWSMFLTILYTSTYTHCWALSTHQLLRLVITLVLTLFTVLHTTKVRTFAYKALIIRQFINSIGPQVIIKSVFRVLQSLMLIYIFKLCSLKCFLKHLIFHLYSLVDLFL